MGYEPPRWAAKSEYARDFARISETLKGHRISPRQSWSQHFAIPGRGGCYAFSLTWTPGTLVLAGDLGELTLTHYHAMPKLEEAIRWCAQSSYDYLLGKSSRRQTYNADNTAEDILFFAEERAKPARESFRDELWEWKRYAPRREEYARSADWYEAAEEWLADKPRLEVERRVPTRTRRWLDGEVERDVYPDGWELWGAIHRELGYGRAEDVFTAGYRETLADDLRSAIGDGQHAAADLCCRLGLDDYYGSESWTYHDLLQVEAMRYGCAIQLAEWESDRIYYRRAEQRRLRIANVVMLALVALAGVFIVRGDIIWVRWAAGVIIGAAVMHLVHSLATIAALYAPEDSANNSLAERELGQ